MHSISNTGKITATLWLLLKSIKSIRIFFNKIFLINFYYFLRPGQNFETTTSHKLFLQKVLLYMIFPTGIYLLKVNNKNTRTRSEICSKFVNKFKCLHLSVVNFEHVIAGWVIFSCWNCVCEHTKMNITGTKNR